MATVNKNFKVKNNIDISSTADTSTAASHYIVETGSDGVIRPKTLSNVRSEVVTTAAVNAAAATTVGTITSGVWNGSSISTTYTDAKVTSVNGSTGAITGLATLASPALTGTPTAPTAAYDTDSTQIATTAYVIGQAGSSTPIVNGTAAVGTSLRYARQDHVHGTDTTRAPLASPTFTGTVTVPTLSLTTADTATTATHYMVETGTDGVVRPKTLANVRTEIVTTAAVNSAAATTVGTITSGTWQGSSISTTYTAAKVTSVNGATGAITGLATLASPTFTGTVILPTSATGGASVRIPHGTAPSSPTNGDVWTTTAGLYARINGSTVGPYGIGTARTFYQATAPTSPSVGDIWVDSDEAVTSLNSNDYVLKSELGDYGFNSFFLSGM